MPAERKLEAETSLSIVVNGSAMELPGGATVSDLLKLLEVRATMVAVEQNCEIVKREEYDSRKVAAGDHFEIVHFVGGG